MARKAALAVSASASDSGAGMQIDVKTFSALGVHCASAVSAITSQNSKGFFSSKSISAKVLEEQIDSALADFNIKHAKIGLLGEPSHFSTIAKKLKKTKIVLDPVMSVQSSGERIVSKKYISEMKKFMKNVYLLTPNADEAEELTGIRPVDEESAEDAHVELEKLGVENSIITGIREKGKIIDYLFSPTKISDFSKETVGKGTHGGGCLFSSAITANLVKGDSLINAVGNAEVYADLAVWNAKKIGKGIEFVDPFCFQQD